jgi:uncharacterized protein YebE (UPF0316 family)
MEFLNALPIWGIALLIFLLRILDVSVGTLRTITVVQGRVGTAMILGFFEVLVWVTAISQVVLHLPERSILALAYAGGFAAGNACGIMLDRYLAVGSCVVRMITGVEGDKLAGRLRELGRIVTTFSGQGHDGPRTLLFTACPRRELETIVAVAREVDPGLFYTVERFTRADHGTPLPHPTGWRAVLKKK